MQLSAIRTEVRNITGVDSTDTVSDATLNDLINKGHNILSDEANLYEGYATANSVSGTAEYQLKDDAGGNATSWTRNENGSETGDTNVNNMIRVYRADYDGSQMSRIGINQISDISNDISDINMTTSKGYYYRDDRIGIFPIPSAAKEIKIYYYHTPTALSNDSDTPALDTRYHESLVYYASWKVVERLRDVNLIPYFKNEWVEWKNKIVLDRQSRAGEPTITIAYKDF